MMGQGGSSLKKKATTEKSGSNSATCRNRAQARARVGLGLAGLALVKPETA